MQTSLRKGRKRLTILENDTLPGPLRHSAPRDVVLNGSGWVAAVCAAALLIGSVGGGLLLAEKFLEDSEYAAELQSLGVPAEAVVTRVRRPGGDNPRVRLDYRYSVAGQEFAGRVQLRAKDPRGRQGLEAGSRLRIRYLPSDPARSWVEGYEPRELPVWLAAFLPVAGVPGGLVILWLLRRQKRLLEEGRAAMARVTAREKTSKYEDSWRVSYSWRLLSGAERKAHLSRAAEPGSGSFLPVVYDPDQPERHAVYPLSLVRVR